jgi:hypothetical protein
MDKLRIHRGLTRYSSPGWEVRLFRFDPGVPIGRDAAPELGHAGLFLGFGLGSHQPIVIPRQIPLFGEIAPFPDAAGAGAIFMTTAKDSLEVSDLKAISEDLFGAGRHRAVTEISEKALKLEEMFRQVLADAYHIPRAA